MARQGLYPDAPKPPCVVGYEGAGVIDAVSGDVGDMRIGTRVMFMTRFGGMSDTVCIPHTQAVAIPDAMSFEDAAAMPVNYLTAHQLLFEIARIRTGDHVLVHMAAGGVGTAALQLCKTVPGVVTIGSASAAKHDYVRSHGADHVIDYRTQDYVTEVKRITEGRGVDFVLDALGGTDWTKGYSILREGGILLCFGLANAAAPGKAHWFKAAKQFLSIPKFSPMKLMDDNRGVAGVNLGHMWHLQDVIQRGLRDIVSRWESGAVKPHLDGVYTFEQSEEAFGRLEHGKNMGKVVMTT
jgi:NADPH:quinone reductase-like Zn-dependent oxidoreductase